MVLSSTGIKQVLMDMFPLHMLFFCGVNYANQQRKAV